MADPKVKDFKKTVGKQLDDSLKKGEIDKATHKKLKKALKAAKTAGSFVTDMLTGSKGFFRTLGKPKGLKWKAAGSIIGIMITLIEAGPCPWTSILVAMVNRKLADAMLDDAPESVQAKIRKLKKKLGTIVTRCTRQANGNLAPQDINKAYVGDLRKVPGVGSDLARLIVKEAAIFSFHTPWELMRVPGATYKVVDALLEGGFYFGASGAAQLALDELAPDMPRAIKLEYEFGYTGGPLVDASFALRHCGELHEDDGALEDSELPAGKRLVRRLVDETGRTVGYRTAAGTALSMKDLAADAEAGKRNLVVVRSGRRVYVRRPANDTAADNLKALAVERFYG